MGGTAGTWYFVIFNSYSVVILTLVENAHVKSEDPLPYSHPDNATTSDEEYMKMSEAEKFDFNNLNCPRKKYIYLSIFIQYDIYLF